MIARVVMREFFDLSHEANSPCSTWKFIGARAAGISIRNRKKNIARNDAAKARNFVVEVGWVCVCGAFEMGKLRTEGNSLTTWPPPEVLDCPVPYIYAFYSICTKWQNGKCDHSVLRRVNQINFMKSRLHDAPTGR